MRASVRPLDTYDGASKNGCSICGASSTFTTFLSDEITFDVLSIEAYDPSTELRLARFSRFLLPRAHLQDIYNHRDTFAAEITFYFDAPAGISVSQNLSIISRLQIRFYVECSV